MVSFVGLDGKLDTTLFCLSYRLANFLFEAESHFVPYSHLSDTKEGNLLRGVSCVLTGTSKECELECSTYEIRLIVRRLP